MAAREETALPALRGGDRGGLGTPSRATCRRMARGEGAGVSLPSSCAAPRIAVLVCKIKYAGLPRKPVTLKRGYRNMH